MFWDEVGTDTVGSDFEAASAGQGDVYCTDAEKVVAVKEHIQHSTQNQTEVTAYTGAGARPL